MFHLLLLSRPVRSPKFSLFRSSRRVTAELHTQVRYVTGPSFQVTSAAFAVQA